MKNTKNTDGIKRQAVVIIHGIGEQRPMDTLGSFVKTILGEEGQKERSYYSKPDTISGSYELRRIKLKKRKKQKKLEGINEDWTYQTDFFEYYWAHHMSGTEWRHVFNWGCLILRRIFCDMAKTGSVGAKQRAYKDLRNHERLRRYFWIIPVLAFVVVAASVVVAFGSYRSGYGIGGATALASAILLLPVVISFISKHFFGRAKNTIGDAARYLDISAENVARRYDILRGGTNMLHNLHEEKSKYTDKNKVRYVYDRIILVGHSLGSIIAYDILKHYWYDVNGRLPINKNGAQLKEAERVFYPKNPSEAVQEQFSTAQYTLWRSLNRKWLGRDEFDRYKVPRARWLITDFITLGSPLSYGTWLLADTVGDFEARTELRELPICPPDRTRSINPDRFIVPLDQEADVDPKKSYYILHHGALFAVTRWTNFYFPKDPIAGPLKNVFGEGIHDIKLTEDYSWFSSHTSYWHSDSKTCSKTCLDTLRNVLKNAAH